MTKFENGPAHGVTLMLKRAPTYLRVVMNSQGNFDALDQLHDTPTKEESLFAYKLHGSVGSVHLNTGGKPGGGLFTVATYQYVESQPLDETMRCKQNWWAWCERMGRNES